jgi:hypothetical protein
MTCGGPSFRIIARICTRLRNSKIDSKESIPPAYVAWRAGTIIAIRRVGPARLYWLSESIPGLFKRLLIRAHCWDFRTNYVG